jgi:hypothetical protein
VGSVRRLNVRAGSRKRGERAGDSAAEREGVAAGSPSVAPPPGRAVHMELGREGWPAPVRAPPLHALEGVDLPTCHRWARRRTRWAGGADEVDGLAVSTGEQGRRRRCIRPLRGRRGDRAPAT